MTRVLLLFAHPALERSRMHRRLLRALPDRPELTVDDLYERYPAFDVDVAREQALLEAHDLVVLQHPFYWYSIPPLLKQWLDLVLEHGWAYGSRGRALEGKRALSVVSTGGGASAYGPQGLNRFTMRELLAPLEATVTLCRMTYLPPFVVHGTHRMTEGDVARVVADYRTLVDALCDDRVDWRAAGARGTLAAEDVAVAEVAR